MPEEDKTANDPGKLLPSLPKTINEHGRIVDKVSRSRKKVFNSSHLVFRDKFRMSRLQPARARKDLRILRSFQITFA